MKLPWFSTGCTSNDIDQDGRDDQIPDFVPMTLFSQPRPVLSLSLETSIRQTCLLQREACLVRVIQTAASRRADSSYSSTVLRTSRSATSELCAAIFGDRLLVNPNAFG